MAESDRRTTIDGDQITDHTVAPQEIEYEGTPGKYKMMIYNENGKFQWFHFIRGRICN